MPVVDPRPILAELVQLTNIFLERVKPETTARGSASAFTGCGPDVEILLARLAVAIEQDGEGEEQQQRILQRLVDLTQLAHTKFYAYPFHSVPTCWLELFRCASGLQVMLGARGRLQQAQVPEDDWVQEMVTILDMAMIMAGPSSCPEERDAVERALELLEQLDVGEPPIEHQEGRGFTTNISFCPPIQQPVARWTHPSLEAFQDHLSHPHRPEIGPEPVIITDSLQHWPALTTRSWSCPEYLLAQTMQGRRLVPVELGRSYVDTGWTQKIMPFREFFSTYVMASSSSSSTGYLAQHTLFSQIPRLRADIAIPDYCYTAAPPPHVSSPLAAKHAQQAKLTEPLLHIWLGPASTISPLHTDPYHNLLAQVVGYKYVRLYAPAESSRLYARGIDAAGVDMDNTSHVDVGLWEGWDGSSADQQRERDRWPDFGSAQYVDGLLAPGDALYIPLGWWHYVRGVSMGCSVSFWWN